jgi:putative spermidine/putrescine transport system permease protein
MQWGALALGAGLLAFLLMLPTMLVAPMSFASADLLEFPPHQWSMRWWGELSRSLTWLGSIRLSLSLALATTLITMPIAVAAAYAAAVAPGLRPLLNGVLIAPLLVPPILVATGLFFVYAKLALNGTFVGLLMGHTLMALPVAYLILRPAIASFDFEQERAARSLGATRWEATIEVLLPQIGASLLAATLLAFLTSLDEVIISIFVGGGENTTLTKIMFESLRDRVDPMTAVVATVWTVFVFAVVIVVQFMTTSRGRAEQRAIRSRM